MSLIDLNGETGYIDGGFGVGLSEPNFLVKFIPINNDKELFKILNLKEKYNIDFKKLKFIIKDEKFKLKEYDIISINSPKAIEFNTLKASKLVSLNSSSTNSSNSSSDNSSNNYTYSLYFGSSLKKDFSIDLFGPNDRYLFYYGPQSYKNLITPIINRIETKLNKVGLLKSLVIEVINIIPEHMGLGSKTQFLLTVAQGLNIILDGNLSIVDLTHMVGRGGTSGIGYQVFDKGGFIVDVGHSFGIEREKPTFLPSSVSPAPPALPLVRLNFPKDWKILLIFPNVKQGANNTEEVNIFQKYCPLPINEVERVSHRVLMQIIPSILRNEIIKFAEALNVINNIGFKRIEIQLQDKIVKHLIDSIYENFNLPVGMSSFGPTIFVIYQKSSFNKKIKDFVNEEMRKIDPKYKAEFIQTTATMNGHYLF